jgi:hypothetical protein
MVNSTGYLYFWVTIIYFLFYLFFQMSFWVLIALYVVLSACLLSFKYVRTIMNLTEALFNDIESCFNDIEERNRLQQQAAQKQAAQKTFSKPRVITLVPVPTGPQTTGPPKNTFSSKLSRLFKRKKTSSPQPSLKKSLSADAIKNEKECIICMNANINTILLPCCHMELCDTCASSISECCTCREKIVERRQVFSPIL